CVMGGGACAPASPPPARTADAGDPRPPNDISEEQSLEADRPNVSPPADAAAAPANEQGTPGDPGPVPADTKVLHVGDSFAGALGKPLGTLLEEAGVRSVLKHTDSSYLTDWAWDGNLQKYLWKYNPDLVLVTLGANELEI